MIFNCGLTRDERDKREKEWHDFFPVFPRTVSTTEGGEKVCAWFQIIERRAIWIAYYDGRYASYEYRVKPSPAISP